ncbi:MAG: HD domain-containing protein [Pirellulales bacterium]|nr:HD domain-containing protein [Pirellulales bacterium]
MVRRFIAELGHQEHIEEVYLASGKQLRPNKNGDLYLQVELADRSGTVTARLWNANDTVYRAFEDGDFVRVTGTAQVYQGSMQMIATRIARVSPEEVDADDFLAQPAVPVDTLLRRLQALLRSQQDPQLKALAECFLQDAALMRKLCRAPAGVKHHHAYLGGLLEHVVSLMNVVDRVVELYPQLNRDLMLLGALLHDLGKVDELDFERASLGYTDSGQLLGHLVLAISLLDEKLQEVARQTGQAVPEELVLRLKHMIVSHHGQYEFGSPKVPMTPEALALHYLDSLDAKLHCFQQLMDEDPNVESSWTLYHQSLGRKLFKGRGASAGAS